MASPPSPPSSSSQRVLVAQRPLEAAGSFIMSSSPSPPPPRPRRPRRVLYPAWRSRRPHLREAVDPARRGLLLLSVLVFLQIYSEETHTCTDLQTQSPEAATCPPQEGDGSLGTAPAWMEEEPWRLQAVYGAAEHQMECTVA